MKLISSSTARRRTANAPLRSVGGPQIPSPVRRIAPNPKRCTEISPPSETFPATFAESSFLFMIDLRYLQFFESALRPQNPSGLRSPSAESRRKNLALLLRPIASH